MEEPRTQVKVFPGPGELAAGAADITVGLIRERTATAGVCNLVLSGGSTPAGLYGLLGAEPLAGRIPWEAVHLFWGDERCVPPDHRYSNYRAARENLLRQVAIPRENIHRMPGELGPGDGARAYQKELEQYFGPGAATPEFDLVLLGLGPDGHTASLFPGRPLEGAPGPWVMGVEPGETEPRVARITLTPTALNAARNVMFLVTGRAKASMARAVRRADPATSPYPAARVRPRGRLWWLLDREAAGS